MDSLEIDGGIALDGEIIISGAKNAALPLMAAGLMVGGESFILSNVPDLADTKLMATLLAQLGLEVSMGAGQLSLEGVVKHFDAPYDLVRKMRASVLVMGPLLARYGQAKISLPGGCAIGTRPIDLHIRSLQKMGAMVELADGYVQAHAPADGLVGAKIVFPFISVGATENALMAACLAKGESKLVGAAREPEIIDLASCLNAMGAKISGAGSDVITIEGVDHLHAVNHEVIPDRIEAGTYAIAAAITGGKLCLKHICPDHLDSLFEVMRSADVNIEQGADYVTILGAGSYQAVDIETQPYPGFPTDLQAQFMAMMCLATGTARLSETIFENRFMHVPELLRMNADIHIDGHTALVRGKPSLSPAQVMATDLRASVCLVLAALATKGKSKISRIYHLDRGYADLEKKLQACGARLQRVPEK